MKKKQSPILTDLYQISKELKRPLILDGAMGSLLQQRDVKLHPVLWASSALITNPEAVKMIHKEYIDAGADIITTNTFRTNPHAVRISGLDFSSRQLVEKAVELARESKRNKSVLIAGSNAPAEDCYQKEVTISEQEIYDNHKEHIELLINSGVDFILNETHSHLYEIETVCKICNELNYPFVISLFFDDNLNLLSGESVFTAIELVKNYSPWAIAFNCIKTSTFIELYSKLKFDYNWGFYLNCGLDDYNSAEMKNCLLPEEYIREIEPLLQNNPLFIGSCCGSSPEHTKAIRKYFDG